MKPKRYIAWSKSEIDLGDAFQKKWYITQVLSYGRIEDIVELDWNEIKMLLPELKLPPEVRTLWENYFSAHK